MTGRESAVPSGRTGFQRYVALGDSQTEGLLDPDGRGGFRGWADRFAEFVAGAGSPELRYANLAVRGRRIGAIRTEQLAAAQALDPDLVTVMAGLNDLLRPRGDLDAALEHLDALLSGFPNATVLVNTFPDLGPVAPMLSRLAARVTRFNDGIRELARSRDAVVVDFDARGAGSDRRIWSADRIHATPFGHALIAAAFAETLGLPGFAGWDTPLPQGRARPLGRAADDAQWLARHVVPWIYRGLRGRSSGDGRSAKRPELIPVGAVFHLLDPAQWSGTAAMLRPDSLALEGFVHLSFAHQVEASADRHCAQHEELVALELDANLAGAPIRIEDSYASGTAFPHLYGPLPRSAVRAVHQMGRDAGGHWRLPAGVLSGCGAVARPSPGR